MTAPKEVLLRTLKDLEDEELGDFKWYLNQEGVLEGFTSIPKADLKNANRSETVTVLYQTYGDPDALIVAREVFKKISRNDLVRKISGSIKEPTDPERGSEESVQPQSVQPQDWLRPVWTDLIERLSTVNVKQILDRLYQQRIINERERDDVMVERTAADKAQKLITEVQNKGPDAVSCLKTALREVNPSLCQTLNLL